MLCFDLIRLRPFWVGSEDADEVLKFPLLDIIIFRVHTVDIALDGIAFIADDKTEFLISKSAISGDSNLHYWLQIISDHRAELLGCQFEGAVANEQDGPSIARFLCS